MLHRERGRVYASGRNATEYFFQVEFQSERDQGFYDIGYASEEDGEVYATKTA